MKIRRREFLASTASLAASSHAFCDTPTSEVPPTDDALLKAANAPLLKLESLDNPLIIESMELLRQGSEFLVHVRSKDGLEAIAVANSKKMREKHWVYCRLQNYTW